MLGKRILPDSDADTQPEFLNKVKEDAVSKIII